MIDEQVSDQDHYPDPGRRLMITISTMLATMMVTVDMTIANVALPHMQSTLSAGPEEIVWVLTSYIIATAIGTPLCGWLAGRFGRQRMMFLSVVGFTLASLACGMANSLEMMVLARLLQGLSGAGLVPLSQATLLDSYPPHLHAKAMAFFSVGSMMGPLVGPALGGWITDAISWRWVFFINLPLGLLAGAGIWLFQQDREKLNPERFDWFGFASITFAIGSFQLMLDRGQQKDWFQSTEIWIEAGIAALAAWFAIVHMFTARNTFIKPQLFADRNFAMGCLMSTSFGVVAFAIVPILTSLLQHQLGYSAYMAGLITFPRGISCTIGMFVVPFLMQWFGPRVPLAAGLIITAIGMFMHGAINNFVDLRTIAIAGFVQGFGIGLLFVPLTTLSFATLSRSLRNEGTAMFNLTRNIGMALGISFLQRDLIVEQAANHARLAEFVRPDSPVVQFRLSDLDFGSSAALLRMDQQVIHQANMFAYLNIFHMLGLVSLALVGVLFFIRVPKQTGPTDIVIVD